MKFNYENQQYLEMLQSLDTSFYKKYVSYVEKYLANKNDLFMDIGCGNGNALVSLMDDGYKNIYGCEISKLFVDSAKRRGLKNIYIYNGKKIPFKDNYFDVIGSFGVLEHAQKPIFFIKEHIRIVKRGGYIIITCPNFLSVFFKLEHPRVNTLLKRLKNIPLIFKKIFSNKVSFERIKPTINKIFFPDDDMINITNIIDIIRFFKKNNCRIIYSNGFMLNDGLVYKIIGSIPILKYFMPSCFVVVRKK